MTILDKDNIAEYVYARHLLDASPDAGYSVEALGGGFLNTVLRIASRGKSVVVKQALDALRLFPDLKVAADRIVYERRALDVINRLFPDGVAPSVLYFDDDNRVLVMSDLGATPLLEQTLVRGRVDVSTAEALGAFLADLHRNTMNDDQLRVSFQNDAMQQLRLQYCFYFVEDPALLKVARRLGALFTEEKRTLLHGDFWTASVMAKGADIRVFDLEFTYYGHPAQDAGFMMAHYLIHAYNTPRMADAIHDAVQRFWMAYAAGMGPSLPEDTESAALRQAGLEMLFRIDGINRVKYVAEDEAKNRIRSAAKRLMLDDGMSVHAVP